MLDCQLPNTAPFAAPRVLNFCFNLLMFIGVLGWVDFVWGQDALQAKPDSTVTYYKPSRDPWLGRDKVDHALVSAGLVAAQFYLLHQEFDWSNSRSKRIAVSSTLAIGIAKEIYDGASRRGTPSWKDLLADLAGVALAVGVMIQ